jgi:hypothetical protein
MCNSGFFSRPFTKSGAGLVPKKRENSKSNWENGSPETLGSTSRHQTHPIVLLSGGFTFPSAWFMGGNSSKQDWINIVLASSLHEDMSVSDWNFPFQLFWIDGSEFADTLLSGAHT